MCPKCQGSIKILSFIEELDIIEKILGHLDLWDIRNHDPQPATGLTVFPVTGRLLSWLDIGLLFRFGCGIRVRMTMRIKTSAKKIFNFSQAEYYQITTV